MLAGQSGISTGTIVKIENGTSEYRTNDGVASALAEALDCYVSDLFEASELSQLGRPPCTGKPIGTITRISVISQHEMLCGCGLVVPKSVGCEYCPSKVMV
jgi:DNA-binding XRE family transcriptional regulator